MTRTQQYAELVAGFRKEMKAAQESANKKKKGIEKYKGSSGYSEEVAKIEDELRGKVKDIQDQYRPKFDRVISDMKAAALSVPIIAPTEEQLRTLELLKMRERLTPDEVRQAAINMKSCPAAMALLRELAKRDDIHGLSLATYESTDSILQHVDDLAACAKTICEMPSVDTRDRWTKKPLYDPDAISGGSRFLSVDRDFSTTTDCIRVLGGVSDYSVFADAVNGDIAE